MSDSDVDLLPNNVFTFQNESTNFQTVSARGPNINASNLTGLSFRKNVMTSTMNLPCNFKRQKYLEQSYDQRRLNYRRDTSPPLSLHSASSFRPRNYQNMYDHRGTSSQRSVVNGRSGSPMSMRSMDSNATISATDIAMAFKNMNFNKYDVKVIKDAYNQFMKRKMRRRIEKRRNLRLFMKGHRRKSGYDSGELGSDSSISSDDCRSTRTTHTSVYRNNMSSCRSTKTDLSDIRRSMKEANLYKDCTENFRQNTFKNMLGVAPRNTTVHMQNSIQNEPSVTQEDRFKRGFLLPSQRFNQSVASVPIPEKQNRIPIAALDQRSFKANAIRDGSEMESEQEEIFSEITITEKSVCNGDVQSKATADPRKRCLEVDDVRPHNKRSKMSSPPKNNQTEMPLHRESNKEKSPNDFEFLKPQCPIRKSGNVKIKEKLLAKSATLLTDTIICTENVPKPQTIQYNKNNEDERNEDNEQQTDLTQHSNSNLSMRPSFIKRKLYTQKFDVLESKNMSSDNLVNSPETNVYSAIQKEKNRARKLVTNQSCLSRDVRDDDLLDLIHKIVPPDRINVTNVTNKSEIANSSAKNKPDDYKWDVTSVITTCNIDDGSDTYTDEEIFNNEKSGKHLNNDNKKINTNKTVTDEKILSCKKNKPNKKSPNKKKSPVKKKSPNSKKSPMKRKSPNKNISECRVLVEELPVNKPNNKVPVPEPEKTKPISTDEKTGKNKENVYNCVKSFWDTDTESDFDCGPLKKNVKEKENNLNQGNLTQKVPHIQNNKTVDTTQSKFVWNSSSSKVVTLKSHNFSSQVKAVNVNKSFTKMTTDKTNLKKEQQAKSVKTTEIPKQPSKRIVLDTYNSTVSDNTQNETVINANNKTRAPPAKKNYIPKSQIPENDISTTATTQVEKPKSKPASTTPKKSKSKTAHNGKTQAKDVDKKITPKRSAPSPIEFTCCKEPVSKKSIKETEVNAKKNKTVFENYNSTLSDDTLDEIIKKGNRTRALRATRLKNIENSILHDLRRDDSQMFNMTLRSRQSSTSIIKGKNDKSKVPTRAEEKARNTSKNSQTKDTQSRQNKTVTPVKGQKSISKTTGKKHSPKPNNKVKSTPKRAVKRK